MEFDVRLPISINPFSKIPEGNSLQEIEDRDEMLATLKPLLQVMAAPKLGTTDLQDALLDRGIRQAWAAKKSKASIDEVVVQLKEDSSKEAQDLGQMLFSFTSQGSYGHFFNPPASCTFNKDFVVIETDHLRNYPEFMAVVVQMLILQINQQMASGDRKTPFLIIIDEAWKLLGGKNSGSFISESTRTARKYKGSIVLGTQHLTDYFREESPAATEAFNCSAWKCILYQESDAITALKRHDQLQYFTETPYRENILRTVRSHAPHFSEVAIFGPEIDGVIGRLCLDPFSRLLYSTNPQEYQAIDALMQEGYSIEESIEIVKEKQRNAA
jgi:conjugal transfer ATP-binding protein TraC